MIYIVANFNPSLGLQHTVDESWIPTLGVRYQLGVDGISIFLVLLTAVLWLAATAWSAIKPPDRARTWFLMLGLAETATLGAFLAQDLILFVLFFDLMLIPFYFLFGSWGTEHEGRPEEDEGPIRPQPATLKMFIYTLVGSLLMLAGAIATGILAADGGSINFNIQHLAADPLGTGSQYWIFWFFAAAFLVKMPPSRCTPGCPTPIGWRRCRHWPSSRACSPRSVPTASCGSSCRSSRRRPRTSRS